MNPSFFAEELNRLRQLARTNPMEALPLLEDLAIQALDGRNEKTAAEAYYFVSQLYYSKAAYTDAILVAEKALQLRLNGSDKIALSASYNGMGIILTAIGKLPEALEQFLKPYGFAKNCRMLPPSLLP